MKHGKISIPRYPGESITLETPAGETITVSINYVEAQQTSVCIDAPLNIAITRTEYLKTNYPNYDNQKELEEA